MDTTSADGDGDLDADSAWELSRGFDKHSVVMVDAGFEFGHPDFPMATQLYYEFDAAGREWVTDTDFDGDASNACTGPVPLCYHGNTTAGILFARWGNGVGIAGLAPNCRLTPLKIFADLAPTSLPPGSLRPADWVRALQWILARKRAYNPNSQVDNVKVPIVSISVNGGADSDVIRWFDSLYANGILCIVSGGNGGGIGFPAYLESVRCVTALLPDGAPGTQIGVGVEGSTLDYSAPGINITTLDLSGSSGLNASGDYVLSVDGSSYATPLVAGVAALVYSRRADLIPQSGPPTAVIAVLDSSAEDQVAPEYAQEFDPPGWDEHYGHGRINAFRALLAVSRGDLNNDRMINMQDVVLAVSVAWRGGDNGVAWHPALADLDCNGFTNVQDVVAVVNVAFRGHALPTPCYEFEY